MVARPLRYLRGVHHRSEAAKSTRSHLEVEGETVVVDAVVVSYRSAATLHGCVAPLAALPGVRVTVVDNASPDDALDTIADVAGLNVVRAPRNGGFGYGCNLGAAQGDAPFLLFLNPDARIDPRSLEALLDVM